MERINEDYYRLRSGFEFKSNRGIIGLSPDDVTLYQGFDGIIYDITYSLSHIELRPEDALEIGEYMKDQWQKFIDEQLYRLSQLPIPLKGERLE